MDEGSQGVTGLTGKRKILVVEDDADSRELLATVLQIEGFDVITAEDGRSGIKVAEAEQPDLVITDINMPELNGFMMAKILREKSDLRKIPILALTAYPQDIIQSAVADGIDKILSKPVQIDALVALINQMLALV